MPNTLKFKVAASLALGLTIALMVFTAAVVRQERQELLDSAGAHVAQLSDVIIRSTHSMMLENQTDYVYRIIEDVARDKSIDRIRIFSKKGEIIYSTHASEIGMVLDRKAEGCLSCHKTDQARERIDVNDRTRVFAAADGRKMLGTMQVIRNAPSCQGANCHASPAQQSVLGVVDIVYPLDDIDATVRSSALRIGVLAFAFALLAAVCMSLFVHRLVYVPLRDLETGAKRLASGNLGEPIPVRSTDEFGQVATSFNTMMTALGESQEQLREAARTLERKVEERTEQLRAAQAESVQHEKLASVGLLAAGIAHELNNPLTGVLTFSHLIRDKMPPGSQDAEDMDLVIRETKRCASIIRRLLDFARQKAPERKLCDVNAVVADVARFIERSARLQDTDIKIDLDPALPKLYVDDNQLKQVVMNILVNAQQASDAGGKIVIRSCIASEPVAPEPGVPPTTMVEISISDTGCGIAEKDLQRIFDPFFTSKEVGKGTGLGLSVSMGIVKAHGGAIRVESTIGKGSTFHIYLPIESPQEAEATAEATAAAANDTGSRA